MSNYPHQQALSDNGLDEKQLPTKIKQSIQGWNMMSKRFEKNPTDKLKETVMASSVKIADAIQNHVEENLPKETQQPEMTPSQQNAPEAPQIPGLIDSPTKSDLKDAIMAHINKDGRIYCDDLKKLIQKQRLDDREEVDGVVLTRNWAFYYPA